jgi:hypothetical protein
VKIEATGRHPGQAGLVVKHWCLAGVLLAMFGPGVQVMRRFSQIGCGTFLVGEDSQRQQGRGTFSALHSSIGVLLRFLRSLLCLCSPLIAIDLGEVNHRAQGSKDALFLASALSICNHLGSSLLVSITPPSRSSFWCHHAANVEKPPVFAG